MTEHEEQSDQNQLLQGLLAEFSDQESLLNAARAVREAGVRRCDSYTPFPIHGMERAMGIRNTRLPWVVFVAGVTGCIVALLLQWWTNAVDYPLNISGKPIFSLPANIPVTFELIVLFSAFAAFLCALGLNGLPRFNNPLFRQEHFRRATSDRFFIGIESGDPLFDETRMRELFEAQGAISIERVHGAARPAKIPLAIHLIGVVVLCCAFIPPLWIAKDRVTKSDVPRIHPVTDMDFQPKFKAQAETSLFADLRTMREPVAGTIARGDLREDDHFYRGLAAGEFAETFPRQFGSINQAMMTRGQQRYNIYCATCHGLAGDGDGITSKRALARADSPQWRPPLSLHSEAVLGQPVGKIYNTIANGVDRENNGNLSMPAYGPQIAPRDRWAIVLYVLALQRSRNAVLDDMPVNERETLQLPDLNR